MKTVQINSSDGVHFEAETESEMEGAHGATGIALSVAEPGSNSSAGNVPDPEVREKKTRRKYSAKYKLRILAEADACSQPGQMGSLLRREGLYSSNLTAWRRQREKGLLYAMAPKKRGRKKKQRNPLAKQVAQLENENRRLQLKLKKAELIIEAQKKMAEILGIAQDLNESDESR
jgi:transposase-like protein